MKKNAWKHWLGLAVLAVAVFITTAGCPIPTRVTPPPHILVQPIDGDLWVDVYFDNRPLKDLFHDLDNYVPRITETQYQTIYAYREDHYRWVPCNDGYYYDELVVVQQTSTPAPPLQVFLAVEFGPNAQIPMLFTPSQAFVRGQSMRVNLSSLTPDWATELAFTVALIQPWNSHPEYTPNWWSPNVGKFCWGKLGHFVIGVGNTTLGEGDITDGLIHINLPFGVQTQQKPIITQQPGNQIANVGQNVTFTSAATGTPTPTGQWFRNGIAIPGATGTSLTLNNVQLGDSGNIYTEVWTNSAGTATTNQATLTVNAVNTNTAPTITLQPISQSVGVGANVTFTSAATGTPTPTGQWFRNGIAIPGATGTSLTLNNVQLGDSGNIYTEVWTNSAGTATTNQATLSVGTITSPATIDYVDQSDGSVMATMNADSNFGAFNLSSWPTGAQLIFEYYYEGAASGPFSARETFSWNGQWPVTLRLTKFRTGVVHRGSWIIKEPNGVEHYNNLNSGGLKWIGHHNSALILPQFAQGHNGDPDWLAWQW